MTIQIPDEVLRAAKLDERQLPVDFARYLYDKDRLGKSLAARMVE